MKLKVMIFATAAMTASGMAHAQLTGTDLAIVNMYQSLNKGVPQYIINEMLAKSELQSVEDYMKGVTYYNGSTNVPIPALDQAEKEVLDATKTSAGSATQTGSAADPNQSAIANNTNAIKGIEADNIHQNDSIRRNSSDIKQESEEIDHNSAAITTNAAGVLKNAANIADNKTAITNTAAGVQNNKVDIADNKAAITNISASIAKNSTNIANQANLNDSQDKVLDGHETRINTNTTDIAQNRANIAIETNVNDSQGKVLNDHETRIDTNTANIAQNRTDIAKEANVNDVQEKMLDDHETRIKTSEKNITKDEAKISQNTDQIVHNRDNVSANTLAIGTETSARIQQSEKQEVEITHNASVMKTNSANIAADQAAIHDMSSWAENTDSRLAEARAEQKKTNQRVADNSSRITENEQHIRSLESSTNSKFSELNKQVDDNRERASAAISGVAAMANIPQVTDKQEFSVGAGAGTTDGESALAVGFSARAGQNVVVKASVSDDTQQNFVLGGGVSYGW